MDLAGGLAFRLDLGAVPTWANLVPLAGTPVGDVDPFDTLAYEPPVRIGNRPDGPVLAPPVPAGAGGRLDAATSSAHSPSRRRGCPSCRSRDWPTASRATT